MRWDNLFDDLESQWDYELHADDGELRAEGERLRLGRLSIRNRLVAIHAAGEAGSLQNVRLALFDHSMVVVRPSSFGKDWFAADLIEGSLRQSQCVVPLGAITALMLSKRQIPASVKIVADGTASSLSSRLGMAFVLRELCRGRKAVELRLAEGLLHGTIDRVGQDHLDLAVHEPGTARRESSINEYRIVPFSQIALVRV